jgi:hypothetical protein
MGGRQLFAASAGGARGSRKPPTSAIMQSRLRKIVYLLSRTRAGWIPNSPVRYPRERDSSRPVCGLLRVNSSWLAVHAFGS